MRRPAREAGSGGGSGRGRPTARGRCALRRSARGRGAGPGTGGGTTARGAVRVLPAARGDQRAGRGAADGPVRCRAPDAGLRRGRVRVAGGTFGAGAGAGGVGAGVGSRDARVPARGRRPRLTRQSRLPRQSWLARQSGLPRQSRLARLPGLRRRARVCGAAGTTRAGPRTVPAPAPGPAPGLRGGTGGGGLAALGAALVLRRQRGRALVLALGRGQRRRCLGGGGLGRVVGLPPRPGAFLRPGSERLPAFVGGGLLRHAWDSVRPGRWGDAIALSGAIPAAGAPCTRDGGSVLTSGTAPPPRR